MESYFKKRWIELNSKGAYKLYAFVVNNNNNYNYVGALVETENTKSVYKIKGFAKNMLLELNENRDGLLVQPYETNNGNKLEILYLSNNKPICTFETNGTVTIYGHTFPKIENLQFSKK